MKHYESIPLLHCDDGVTPESPRKGSSIFTAMSRRPLVFMGINALITAIIALLVVIVVLALAQGHASNDCMPEDFVAPCNGRGSRFEPDMPCECWDCFTGPDCSTAIEEEKCTVYVAGGQPSMLEEYWFTHRNKIAPIHTSIDYRVPYQWDMWAWADPLPDTTVNQLAILLNKAIRDVHTKFGNVVTEGRYIVIGTGARTLTAAALYAFSTLYNKSVTNYVKEPYYPGYLDLCRMQSNHCNWNSSKELDIDIDGPIWEIATVPNNPDGEDREPFYGKSSNSWAYDLVYYWPHFFPNVQKKDAPISFFSFTKMTGHAGARFGWAIVKDAQVAEKMTEWLITTTIQGSADGARRALQIFQYLNGDYGEDYFTSMRNELARRWSELNQIFPAHGFTIKSVTGTAYAWIQCPDSFTEFQCTNTFESVGLLGWSGRYMGMTSSPYYYRINLTIHTINFEMVIAKLKRALANAQQILANHNGDATSPIMRSNKNLPPSLYRLKPHEVL